MASSLVLVDSHAHLTLPEFDHDRKTVIQRALNAGIKYVVAIGIDLEDCQKAVALADEYPFIFVAVGIHPHDTKTIRAGTYAKLREMAIHKKVVAIGEIGLDFYRNISPQPVQDFHFRGQLRLAAELSLPVIIHDRDAHHEILTTLREERWEGMKGVIHCFSGDKRSAEAFLDLGFYLSIPGTVTFKNSRAYQETVSALPLDRLLLETDSPFLSPHPLRGKRNEPANVFYVAQALASLKRLTVEEVAEVTAQNASELFKLTP